MTRKLGLLLSQLIFLLQLSACATFDKTNIQPGQRVPGLGFSFVVPTEKPWFAVVYGNSHRIRLSQLNHSDSYTIQIALNRGPFFGMYPSAKAHLQAVKRHKLRETIPTGFEPLEHKEWIDTRYGDLCVRFSSKGRDWRGRVGPEPADVEVIGLNCAHETLNNVLISIELTRRADKHADPVELSRYADALFLSIEYESLE